MKKLIICLLTVVMLFMLCSCGAENNADANTQVLSASLNDNSNIKVISYNIAGPWGDFLKGTHYSTRMKLFVKQIKNYYPDSFGTQEMNYLWEEELAEKMPEYACYGTIRGGDDNEKKSEKNSIFYLKDKYNLVDSGTFWLSETPDEMSEYEGAGCYRICSWVLLENKTTGYRYIHMNTHLDNASEEAAKYGAGVIVEKYNELLEKYPDTPVILTGDFNQTIGSVAYNTINDSTLDDTRFLTDETNNESTYNAWVKDSMGAEPIDHIFVSENDYIVTSFSMLERTTDGKLVSDHFAIMASLGIN